MDNGGIFLEFLQLAIDAIIETYADSDDTVRMVYRIVGG